MRRRRSCAQKALSPRKRPKTGLLNREARAPAARVSFLGAAPAFWAPGHLSQAASKSGGCAGTPGCSSLSRDAFHCRARSSFAPTGRGHPGERRSRSAWLCRGSACRRTRPPGAGVAYRGGAEGHRALVTRSAGDAGADGGGAPGASERHACVCRARRRAAASRRCRNDADAAPLARMARRVGRQAPARATGAHGLRASPPRARASGSEAAGDEAISATAAASAATARRAGARCAHRICARRRCGGHGSVRARSQFRASLC